MPQFVKKDKRGGGFAMSNKTDSLGNRMKIYESVSRNYLTRRIPAVIRLDGKAFHTFTRGMVKPFDPVLTQAMQQTMKYLCENIQGCVFGYTQSDEITLVLTDYASIKTDAWFGYNVQKMISIAASMATLSFNQEFARFHNQWFSESIDKGNLDIFEFRRLDALYSSKHCRALFDARVFSIPKEEVCNCLIWRQQDATRNSIEAVGQANFSHRQLHKKSCNEIQEMLWIEKDINWNDFPAEFKRGSCCVRQVVQIEMDDPRNPGQKITVERRNWVIDKEIPIFTKDRSYIEKRL